MIAAANGHLRGVTHGHVEALRRFAVEGQSGRSLVLPQGLVARKEFDWLIVSVPERGSARNGYSYAVEVPGETQVPELGSTFLFKIVNSRETEEGYNVSDGPRVDLSKLEGQLRIRSWLAGDSFRPVGSRKAKKVKELFQKRRIPLGHRRLWPVLTCGTSVIWVRGFPPDDRVVASPSTERVVTILEEPLEVPGCETER
jgi:tRNA(Ile)-lysidine synthetase-like protein